MKKFYTLSLCLALLMLVACGENWYGSSSSGGSDIKSLRLDAENAFRKGNYESSYNICKKITEIEPSSSFGYYGMAKAGLWWHGVNPLSMFSLVKQKDGECPFMGEEVKMRNNYLQAMKKVVPALSELDRRDSLTSLWEFHTYAREHRGWDSIFTITIFDLTSGKNVSKDVDLDERLSDFRKTFCGGSSNNDCSDTTSGKRKPFPLSDKEYKNSYFGGILLLTTFSKSFLNFFDTNKDSCLTRSPGDDRIPGIDYPSTNYEWKKWGCIGSNGENSSDYDLSISMICERDVEGNMSVRIDTKQVLDDLEKQLQDYYKGMSTCTKDCEKNVPDEVKGFNDKINDFSDDFSYVEDLLSGMGLGGGDDMDGSLKNEVNKYKAYSAFYKMGTHFDEDGDGCIDEELLDGFDNDGDGFVNENSRLSPIDQSDPYYGISPMNNCMVGNDRYKNSVNWEYNKPVRLYSPPDNRVRICNDPQYENCSPLDSKEGDPDSVTVLNFTQKTYPNGKRYWTSNKADDKLKVAQDKDCSKYNLQDRINLIGGCWPWYSQQQFDDYCKDARSRN